MMELCEKCSVRANVKCKIVSERECVYCCGLFSKLKRIGKEISEFLKEYNVKTIEIGCKMKGSIKELEELLKVESSIKEEVKEELSRILSEFKVARLADAIVTVNAEDLSYSVRINPIYIYGRYIKRVRNIPQTRWICSACKGRGCQVCGFTGKKYDMSVEEYIGFPVLEITKGKDAILHGAGREDVDARMLGKGRPFILEVREPRIREVDLKELERAVNEFAKGKVSVKFFGFVRPKHVSELKTGNYKKVYRALVEFEREVDKKELERALEKLSYREIEQFTPERVEHRRANILRKRKTYGIKLLLHRGKRAVIVIEADSGLYIKELVSGDKGRTKPSLSEILNNPSRVVRLDVIDVMGGLKFDPYSGG